MSFTPPKPLVDARGVPTNRKFDVMLSYQWDAQEMVRGILNNNSTTQIQQIRCNNSTRQNSDAFNNLGILFEHC